MTRDTLPAPGPQNFVLGAVGALAPFVAFIAGIVLLTMVGGLSSATGGAVAFIAFVLVFLTLKDKKNFATLVFAGLRNRMLGVLLISFLLAGVMGAVMDKGGLVTALVWGASQLNVPAWLIPVALFVIVTLIGLATGTNAGTIVTTLPILLPVGVAMGVHPGLVIGAIVGGAMWGDNLAPVSDTTIVSALTQETSVARVVRSRLRYAGVAGGLAVIGYIVLGIVLAPSATNPANAASTLVANPLSLVLLLAPAVIVILMILGKDIVYALTIAAAFSAVLAMVTGLIAPADFVSKEGVIVSGFTGMMSIFPFFIFLFCLIEALTFAGAIAWIGDQALRVSRTPRTAETISAAIAAITYLVTTVHSVSVVVSGPVVRSVMRRFNVDRARSANTIDCIVSGLHGIAPHSAVTVIVMGIVAGSEWVPDDFQALDYLPFVLPSLFLLLVFAVAIATGWGRRSEPEESSEEADAVHAGATDAQ